MFSLWHGRRTVEISRVDGVILNKHTMACRHQTLARGNATVGEIAASEAGSALDRYSAG